MTTSFEMREIRDERRALHWSTTSEEFGDIKVRYPADIRPATGTGARAEGSAIPTTLLISWSIFGDKPRLNGAHLRVDGQEVKLRRNRWAVRRKGRALRMTHDGTEYRCSAISRKRYVLTRPGLAVTVTDSGIGTKRRRLRVVIDGAAEPVDVSLAVLFAGVNRSHLTLGGAFRAGFSTVFNLWADNAARS
ncbi:hypothetical protein OG264_19205 [Streptomyces xanthophaeus]|uniref:hypothetical protein n=1 Tax=Streptomyces xanthophaeus TaxID=67385 RepID=UPI00386DA43F|nr:hypothetical protein OG264_19205 [Streptomyces xanthophaeus]WST61579.1 hypothetical protein OG605_19230 [Streptomyces xanthophaeus]